MIFAADGSGGSDTAGYGVAIYDPNSDITNTYFGVVLGYEIISAELNPMENRLNIQYNRSKIAKATNNRGELCAIWCALLLARQYNVKNITIVTDSKYCIGTFTEWYSNWLSLGITHKKKNIDLIKLIYNDYQVVNPHFVHQKAHMPKSAIERLTGTDKLHARLNRLADDLANLGRTNLH